MSDTFKRRMRNLDGVARPSSAATIIGQVHDQPIVTIPVSSIAPDPLQVRFLPTPADLLAAEIAGDEDARALLSELRALGQSLAQRQIHPLLVYPIVQLDPDYPEAEWRILSGERALDDDARRQPALDAARSRRRAWETAHLACVLSELTHLQPGSGAGTR